MDTAVQVAPTVTPTNTPPAKPTHTINGGVPAFALTTEDRRRGALNMHAKRALTKEAAAKLALEMLAANALKAVGVVVDVMDNEAEAGSTRASAANSVLDRVIGKPASTMAVEVTARQTVDDSTLDELEARLLASFPHLELPPGSTDEPT